VKLQSLTFDRSMVSGGMPVTGTVRLTCVPGEDVLVTLLSNRALAKPAQSRITIHAGETSGQFTINTLSVRSPLDALITAKANGSIKTGTLRLLP
jgi:hypothetical protein